MMAYFFQWNRLFADLDKKFNDIPGVLFTLRI